MGEGGASRRKVMRLPSEHPNHIAGFDESLGFLVMSHRRMNMVGSFAWFGFGGMDWLDTHRQCGLWKGLLACQFVTPGRVLGERDACHHRRRILRWLLCGPAVQPQASPQQCGSMSLGATQAMQVNPQSILRY